MPQIVSVKETSGKGKEWIVRDCVLLDDGYRIPLQTLKFRYYFYSFRF